MRRTILVPVLAVVALLAGCGSDDDTSDSTEAPEPETQTLTVRVVADTSGFGCTQATQRAGFAGNDSQVAVTDDDGTVVGTGTFGLSYNADSCDWTATVDDVPVGSDFYRLEHQGAELATLSTDDLGPGLWSVDLRIDVSGNVRIEP